MTVWFNITITYQKYVSTTPLTISFEINIIHLQNMNHFWLRNIEPKTEYYLSVMAIAKYGRKKLKGMPNSIVFAAPDRAGTFISILQMSTQLFEN